MSGDFDRHTHSEDREDSTPVDDLEIDSRPGRATQGELMAAGTAPEHGQRSFFRDLQKRFPAAFWRKHLALTVFLGMLLFPIGAVVVGYVTRPVPGTAGQTAEAVSANPSDSGIAEKRAKPAAGKPFTKPESPPPSVEHPATVPALPTQPPAGVAPVPQQPLTASGNPPNPPPNAIPPPSPPGVAAKPPYTPVVYQARHDKHFGDSCSGQLTLDSSGLVFKCLDDPSGNVQVGINDIQGVDGNGVRLVSGKKYHFSIAGMAKSNEEQLFANWLGQVR